MSSVRIELDSAGIQALLKSNEMADCCEKEAERMTRAAGVRYEADVYQGKTRVNAGAWEKGERE